LGHNEVTGDVTVKSKGINDNNKENLKTLQERVTLHFTHEEATMAEKSYDDIAAHKAIHAAFVEKLAALEVPLDTGDFAKDW
jgi:hemerythrin-like metal-binding protein